LCSDTWAWRTCHAPAAVWMAFHSLSSRMNHSAGDTRSAGATTSELMPTSGWPSTLSWDSAPSRSWKRPEACASHAAPSGVTTDALSPRLSASLQGGAMIHPDCAMKRPLSASTSAEPGPIRKTARPRPGVIGLPGWFSKGAFVPSSRRRTSSPAAVTKMPPPVWSAKPGEGATSAWAVTRAGWKASGLGVSWGSEGSQAANRPASRKG